MSLLSGTFEEVLGREKLGGLNFAGGASVNLAGLPDASTVNLDMLFLTGLVLMSVALLRVRVTC